MGSIRRARPRSRGRTLSDQPVSSRNRAWPVLERRGSAALLHASAPDPGGHRLACVCFPVSPAVVIGSAQPASDFDADRMSLAGVGLARRRSGGGAVLVAPGCQLWLDVFVPSDDVLAQPDVGKSFHWLGDAFAQAIAAVLGTSAGELGIVAHRGSVQTSPWSKVLCYAGLGAGEVTVAGRKVVGMSQRRERSGAWIYSMALIGGQARDLADLLTGDEERRAKARKVLDGVGLAEASASR